MRRSVSAVVAAVALVAVQTPAQARDGAALAAGIIGGLALGGLAAAAAAQPVYAYPAYGYRPVYYAPPQRCWRERRRAVDDFGNVYYRRIRVCD